MLEADFTTGAILISFGAVLGVASPVQLLLMILFEVIFYNVSGNTHRFKNRTDIKIESILDKLYEPYVIKSGNVGFYQ